MLTEAQAWKYGEAKGVKVKWGRYSKRWVWHDGDPSHRHMPVPDFHASGDALWEWVGLAQIKLVPTGQTAWLAQPVSGQTVIGNSPELVAIAALDRWCDDDARRERNA